MSRAAFRVAILAAIAICGCNAPIASEPSPSPPSGPAQPAPPAAPAHAIATKLTTKRCDKDGHGCVIYIRGELEAGAAANLESLIASVNPGEKHSRDLSASIYYIASPGGDVDEGMAIGRVLRRHNAVVYADGPCYSSCVFVLAGGVRRYLTGEGEVGIHRSFVEGGTVDIAAYRAAHAGLDGKVLAYFREMNVSPIVLDLMAQVPSEGIRILKDSELKALGLAGVDPVWQDFENGRAAAGLGLTTSQFLERLGRMNAECGAVDLLDSRADYQALEGCKAKIMYAPPARVPTAEDANSWAG